jgi:hypothetical protein
VAFETRLLTVTTSADRQGSAGMSADRVGDDHDVLAYSEHQRRSAGAQEVHAGPVRRHPSRLILPIIER